MISCNEWRTGILPSYWYVARIMDGAEVIRYFQFSEITTRFWKIWQRVHYWNFKYVAIFIFKRELYGFVPIDFPLYWLIPLDMISLSPMTTRKIFEERNVLVRVVIHFDRASKSKFITYENGWNLSVTGRA